LASMNSIKSAFGGGGRSVVVRLAAIALLVLISADLTDVACDPLGIHLDRASLTQPAPPGEDSCGALCIPDCFCCAHTLPAKAAFVIWKAEILLDPPPQPACRSVAGFSFILDHVPLSLA
jgi:hypothetical protein